MSKPVVLEARCAEHPDFLFSSQMDCPACDAIAATEHRRGFRYQNKIAPLSEWARQLGVTPSALRDRLKRYHGCTRRAFNLRNP